MAEPKTEKATEEGTKAVAADECKHPFTKAGDKCGDCALTVEEITPAFGGATTFADVDDYIEGREEESNVDTLQWQFNDIVRNIWRSGEMSLGQKSNAIVSAADELSRRISVGPEEGTKEESLLDKAIKFIFGDKAEPKEATGFSSPEDNWSTFFKDDDGEWRWLAVVTNKFVDREGEIFTARSHKEFENYLDKTKEYPELRLWHVPGSRVGQADFWAYTDGFVVSSGTFDKEFAHVAESLAASEDPIAVSHGYRYPEALHQGGVYEAYRSFEISVLPEARASNVWTPITIASKEVRMLSPTKRAFLVKHLGEGRTGLLETGIATLNKELEGAGVAFKDFLGEGDKGEESPSAEAEGAATGAESEEEKPAAKAAGDEEEKPEGEEPAGEEEKPAEGAEGEEKKEVSGELTLEAIAGAFEKMLEPIRADLKTLGSDVKEIQETDDEKIAARIRPRVKVGSEERPSTSSETETELPEEVKAILDASPGEGYKDDGVPSGVAPAAGYVQDWLLGGEGSKKKEAAASS